MAKRINSSKKGAKAERDLSKALSQWVGVEFQRVPRSGGLRWGSGLMVTGDTIPADPVWLVRFPFSVESKTRDSINFQELILDQKSEIWSFWEQSKADSERVNKIPIVFFRYNFLKKGLYFVVVSWEVFKCIRKPIKKTQKYIEYFNYSNRIVIFPSNYLLETDYLQIEKSIKHLANGKDSDN